MNLRSDSDTLFDRIAQILDAGRHRVVTTVNQETVTAYWLIGREIVLALQRGEERAEYGEGLIAELSARLTERYGKGFSEPNLRNFRQFYLAFPARCDSGERVLAPRSLVDIHTEQQSIRYPLGSESTPPFHPNLSWSHYRALMRVQNESARDFYQTEAVRCNWTRRELERQISTLFYERLLASQDKAGMLESAVSGATSYRPLDVLKDPYVLEFLDLPDVPQFHESDLEQAIIDNLQHFLLEIGRGFSFVARQKRLRFGDKDFYVDLVFYNYLLKCFVLVDLKMGELTHQDIGQMDGYVRLFEEHGKVEGDNPTIGLILCSEKNEAVARYSVLHESRQLFASRYMLFLPSEDELKREIEHQRALIENKLEH